MVDLAGQLSNPPTGPENRASPGVEAMLDPAASGLRDANYYYSTGAISVARTNPGQHSYPQTFGVRRRPRASDIGDLVAGYQAGRFLRDLAAEFGIHHHTVAAHLERHGITRRLNIAKLGSDDVTETATRYRAGASLATVAAHFGVDVATVRRALHRSGEPIRPDEADKRPPRPP